MCLLFCFVLFWIFCCVVCEKIKIKIVDNKKKKKSRKRKLSSFTTKTMVFHFCKGCDVHMFFVEEIIEAVSSIAKRWPKKKD